MFNVLCFFFSKEGEESVSIFLKFKRQNYIKDHMAVTKNYKKTKKGFSKF